MPRAMLLMLGLCLTACSIEAPDGASAGGGGVAPVLPVQPTAPAVDVEAVKAAARKAALDDLGFDPAEAREAIKAKREAEEKNLSDAQKSEKALREAAKRDAEQSTALAAATQEIAALKAASEMRDVLDANGVSPKARVMVEALYAARKGVEKSKFDEEKFFEETRTEFPNLFGSAGSAGEQSSGSNTTAATAPAHGSIATPYGVQSTPFNALTATPEQRRQRRNEIRNQS